MRTMVAAIALMTLTTNIIVPAFAEEKKQPSVKFGVSCKGAYGYMRKQMTVAEAHKALEEYFAKRQLEVNIVDHSTRFVRTEILKGKKHVDTIILDLKTGRMRSIYH